MVSTGGGGKDMVMGIVREEDGGGLNGARCKNNGGCESPTFGRLLLWT